MSLNALEVMSRHRTGLEDEMIEDAHVVRMFRIQDGPRLHTVCTRQKPIQ